MPLQGKGIFIWQVGRCEDGDPNRITQRALSAGLSHVLIKIADGTGTYNAGVARPVVEALKTAGIQAWGWHYVYGVEPAGEAEIAIRRTLSLGLDGYVVNAEEAYKEREESAAYFMDALRDGVGGTPLALSSFRYPAYHDTFPWPEFLSRCDLNMPQVYWLFNDNPAEQVAASVAQFGDVYPPRPIVPTGAAFAEGSWRPTPAQITGCMQAAQALGLPGVNFWSWDYAGSSAGRDLWEAIAAYPWPVETISADTADAYMDALNRGDLDAVVTLYRPDAVLVTQETSYTGTRAIRRYYAGFLSALAGARCRLTTRVSEGYVRRLRWLAELNGTPYTQADDVMHLSGGRIAYHTTRR